jgi:uncharacterized membrane protein YfcA
MDAVLTLGVAFVLICGGMLGLEYSKSGRVEFLLAAGSVFGVFLIALYFISASRRKAEEKARRKQAAARQAAYQKETEDFLKMYRK